MKLKYWLWLIAGMAELYVCWGPLNAALDAWKAEGFFVALFFGYLVAVHVNGNRLLEGWYPTDRQVIVSIVLATMGTVFVPLLLMHSFTPSPYGNSSLLPTLINLLVFLLVASSAYTATEDSETVTAEEPEAVNA